MAPVMVWVVLIGMPLTIVAMAKQAREERLEVPPPQSGKRGTFGGRIGRGVEQPPHPRGVDRAGIDAVDPDVLGHVIGGVIQIRSGILANHDVSIILASHDLTISADLLPGLYVLGTEEMIETVVENLIENAVSFSPAGSEILVHLARDGRFAHLTISDQGTGVPTEQLERIFDRYYSERRAEAASDATSSYFGIGLWIARRNVEAMGGTVEAENLEPQGLAIHVRLPLAPERG